MNVPDSGTVVLLADRVMESFEPEELEALREVPAYFGVYKLTVH
jgi:hypothetical protein